MRTDQTLGHGGLAVEKGAGDLAGGQSAKRAQGKCYPAFGINGRVAARKDQRQAFVGNFRHFGIACIFMIQSDQAGDFGCFALEVA